MTKAYKFDLEVEGQHQIGNVNVLPLLTSSHDDRLRCQIWLANVKSKKSYEPDTKTCQKSYKIWIMNVRDRSSQGDTPMCQIW